MAKAVHNQRMHARISGEYLKSCTRGRVALEYDGNVFFEVIKHGGIMPQSILEGRGVNVEVFGRVILV